MALFVGDAEAVSERGGDKGTEWKKFEYFNFPIPDSNDSFLQLSQHFESLKKVYITCNYIDAYGKIDLASAFIDQNYDCLSRDLGKKYKTRHLKILGRKPVLH